MMPRLAAEESLEARERLAVGTGAVTQAEAQRIVTAWQRQARGGDRVRAATPTTADLAGMGLRVIHG